MTNIHHIPVKSDEDVWFLEKQINVFDFLDFFPRSSLAKENKKGELLHFETDLGWSFDTDIESKSFALRQKSKTRPGTGKWVRESDLKPGDKVNIEKLDDYRYRLYKT